MAAGAFPEACSRPGSPTSSYTLADHKLNREFEFESNSRGSLWSICSVLPGRALVSCVLGNADSEGGGIGKSVSDSEK